MHSKLTSALTLCLVTILSIVYVRAQDSAASSANPNPELVGQLTKQLNVTPEQATGGAGAIFGYTKSKLSPSNFSKIASSVPGMDGFLKAAPSTGGTSASALNSLGGAVPGSAGSMASGAGGGVASLAGSFQKLGLSPDMVSKFAPVMQNYIGSKGGSGVAGLFASALH